MNLVKEGGKRGRDRQAVSGKKRCARGGRGEKGGGGEEGKIKKKRPNGKMEKRGKRCALSPILPEIVRQRAP